MNRVQVFVSYDAEHDRDLYERLLGQSKAPDSEFDVMGASDRGEYGDQASTASSGSILDAEQVIFLCSAHTAASSKMRAELQLVCEQRTPYILLWGRREVMCKKPAGAKSSTGMYIWTREILRDQMTTMRRGARADAAARSSDSQKKKGPVAAASSGTKAAATLPQSTRDWPAKLDP